MPLDMRGIDLVTGIIRDHQVRKRAAQEFDTVQAQKEKEAQLQDEHRKFVEAMASKTYDEQVKQHEIQNKFALDTAKLQKAKFVQEIGEQYIKTGQLPAGVTETPGEVISPARQELVPGVPIPQIGAVRSVPEVRGPSTYSDPAVGTFTLPDPNKAVDFQVTAKEKMLAPDVERERQRIEATGKQRLALEREQEINRAARDKRLQEGREQVARMQENLRLETEKLRMQGNISVARINANSRLAAAEIRGTLNRNNRGDLPVHLNKQANEFALTRHNVDRALTLLDTKIKGTDQTVSDYVNSKGFFDFLGKRAQQASANMKLSELPEEVSAYLSTVGKLKGVNVKEIFGATFTARDEKISDLFMLDDGLGENHVKARAKLNTIKAELNARQAAIVAGAGSHSGAMEEVMRAASGMLAEKPKAEDDGKGNLFIK